MKIVEIYDTVGWYAIYFFGELQFRNKSTLCSAECCNYHGTNPFADGITSKHKYWPVTSWSSSKPNFTALHQPSPPNLLPHPSQQF